ncbi:galactokinase [Lacimicrobium sp. SS2-24]|uniref:galactokinase n=1 Tax=Lacimicrobium sp. SS2-24 TaxID=2005569 RepID=UPI000B4AFD5F|nr:galactokinase [Lacimicrobium sp. SS2-24]
MTESDVGQAFQRYFKTAPQGIASAPGRVNLIGEFTDFNNGFVYPVALQFRTQTAYRLRDDNEVRVISHNYPGESDQFCVAKVVTPGECQWGNYVRAVFATFQRRGYRLRGMDLAIASNVPQGAGLSSSAALEVSIAGAINAALSCELTPEQMALIGQQAENEFMHCQCGIMDQLVSATGRAGQAVLIDCADLSTDFAPLPEHLSLLVINSNVPRKLVDSAYNQRRQDCEDAARIMGLKSLRDATLPMLQRHRSLLTDNQFARARHVISENHRVIDFHRALKDSDIQQMSELMRASHRSLREDFEVTVPATDGLVSICDDLLGNTGAARMTGGGFGGAILCLCPHHQVEELCRLIEQIYPDKFGLQADIYIAQAGNGLTVEMLSV